VSCIKKRWRQRHLDENARFLKEWGEKNPEKLAAIKKRWQKRHVEHYRSYLVKYYRRNAAKKMSYRCILYRRNVLHQLRLRHQRYKIGLLIDSQYYRNKNMALLRAGEAAVESKYAKILAIRQAKKCMRKKRKQSNKGQMMPADENKITVTGKMMHEAKITVTKVVNVRLKCVMHLKQEIECFKNHCQRFVEKSVEGDACTLEELCGSGRHCRGREPYYYEYSYNRN